MNPINHVAIIMDGNGRWAKQKGEMRIFGHTSGVDSVREALTAAGEIGVEYLTLYAFSTENWNRPKDEIAALMDLLVQSIYNEVDIFWSDNSLTWSFVIIIGESINWLITGYLLSKFVKPKHLGAL